MAQARGEPVALPGHQDFPAFPDAARSERVADRAGGDDEAVEEFGGISAAVIVGGTGHWSGAAGIAQGNPLTAASPLPIASIGKTVTAAQVLRLVEEGAIGIDDPAADHLPPELDAHDANGATVRELLGMRSGIDDEMFPEPAFPAGSTFSYESMNYVLLGNIIEHVTGRSLWEVLRSDVLRHPGLGGLRYPVRNALAADGSGVESDPASLAGWASTAVRSCPPLLGMTDFSTGYTASTHELRPHGRCRQRSPSRPSGRPRRRQRRTGRTVVDRRLGPVASREARAVRGSRPAADGRSSIQVLGRTARTDELEQRRGRCRGSRSRS